MSGEVVTRAGGGAEPHDEPVVLSGLRRAVDRVAAAAPRPLDRVRSVKLKLAVLMTFAGVSPSVISDCRSAGCRR